VVTADSVDGAALSAFQYFENVRNFLVAAQDIGLPCFEASDLEQVRLSERPPPRPHCRKASLACLLLQQSAYDGIFALNTHSRASWSWSWSCDPHAPFFFAFLSERREGRAPGW
jgi:hypothetical protein